MKASEYRQMGKQPLETSTGATFTVGRIPGQRLLDLFEAHGVDMADPEVPPAKALEMAMSIVPEFVDEVAPKGEGNDELVGVEELYFSDLIELFNHIMSRGVGEEAMERAQRFRVESSGTGGSTGGPGLWTPADGGPEVPGGGNPLEPGVSPVRPRSGE